jgi:hypothetical protein
MGKISQKEFEELLKKIEKTKKRKVGIEKTKKGKVGKKNKRSKKLTNIKNKKNKTTNSLEICIKDLDRSIKQNSAYLKKNNKLFEFVICSLNKNKNNKLLNY